MKSGGIAPRILEPRRRMIVRRQLDGPCGWSGCGGEEINFLTSLETESRYDGLQTHKEVTRLTAQLLK
jgi:hypothetical protein